MGIFFRRPLSLFCFLFLFTSFISCWINVGNTLVLSLAFLLPAIVIFCISFVFKHEEKRLRVITLFLCLTFASLGFLHSFVFTKLPQKYAEEFVGQRKVLCYIIRENEDSSNGAEYAVKIKNIDGEKVNIKAVLDCGFDPNLNAGDEIYGIAKISGVTDVYMDSDGYMLNAYMGDENHYYYRKTSEKLSGIVTLFHDSGYIIISDRISEKLKNIAERYLDDDISALAIGFLTGNREDISLEITRDFRRAGVSHLMAVSGSHITILLGSVEILLRKLLVDKKYRYIIVSVLGLAFLFVTGFSASACRSVLMLYGVYISYHLYEDSDGITSLFVSVFCIIFISPFAIKDLSLWMSFLATLGLLTVYPVVEERIPYPRKKKGIIKALLLVLREIALIALMTVVANVFLLPIAWLFFGEISLVAVLANILVGLLSSLFLILVPVFFTVSFIPFVREAIVWIISFLGKLIIYLVGLCSKLPVATLSLKYAFCGIIILLFSVSMVIFLVIRFRKKWLVFIPIGTAAVALCIGYLINGIFFTYPVLSYAVVDGDNELISIQEGIEISFCDNTDGSGSIYYTLLRETEDSHSTEIKNYVITHCHSKHASLMNKIAEKMVVRNIYLPVPRNEDERLAEEKIWNMAKENGIDVYFYENGQYVPMTKNSGINILNSKDHSHGSYIKATCGAETVEYMTPYFYDANGIHDVIIFGSHGMESDAKFDLGFVNANGIYYSSEDIRKNINIFTKAPSYFPVDCFDYNRVRIYADKKD